jgi:hypothetical protein
MSVLRRYVKSVIFVLIAVSVGCTLNGSGRGAEVSKSASSGLTPQVSTEDSLDESFLHLKHDKPNFYHFDPDFAFSKGARKDNFNFDFKTDHEVNIKKYMPTDTVQERLLDRADHLYGTLSARRSIPFLGLSVTKSLN